MTAVLMTLPVLKFTDSSGAPLAGGKVYFYAAGTSTPKDTYTTAAGSVANTNPVILDSQGAAVIFLSGSYKVNLTDSAAVQQSNWPVDNITSFQTGAVGATFSDGTFTLQNASDLTKQGMFDLSSLTTGTEPVIKWPTSNGTMARIADITDANVAFTDVTTGDVSTTKHGFAPKSPNDITKKLDGTGAYTVAALSQSSPSDPTGTTDTTGKMMGLAGSFTPTSTGRALIVISGDIANGSVNDGAQVQIRYGTGSAPANAAALTGTTAGGVVKYNGASNTAAIKFPFALNAIVTGLTVNTAYWIDIGLAAITAGTASIKDISISVVEV